MKTLKFDEATRVKALFALREFRERVDARREVTQEEIDAAILAAFPCQEFGREEIDPQTWRG